MHVGQHATVERHHVAEAGIVDLEAADDVRLAALENLDDAAFSPLVGTAFHSRDDPIAVHRFGKIRGCDVDVAGVSVLRHDKAEAAGVGGQSPDDEIHLLGQSEAIAANLQQIARRDECLELSLEAGAFFARHAQYLHQLASGGRMMDRLTNAVEEILIATQRE